MAAWTRVGMLAGIAGTATVLTVQGMAAGGSVASKPSISVTNAPTISVSQRTATGAAHALAATRIAGAAQQSSAGSAAAASSSSSAGKPSGSGGSGSTNSHKSGGIGHVGCNDGTVYYTPSTIWPPDHKMQTITIWYVDNDGDGDSTKIAVDMISDNQVVNGQEFNGSGQPTAQQGADWTGTGNSGMGSDTGSSNTGDSAPNAMTYATVRAERSGTDMAGRTYDIQVTCTDTGGNMTAASAEQGSMMDVHMADLLVYVPHDQGNNVPN